VAANGVNLVRTGIADWSLKLIDGQLRAEADLHTAVAAHGMHCWLWLALDRQHPLVVIQAPRSRVAELVPYRPAFDITGVTSTLSPIRRRCTPICPTRTSISSASWRARPGKRRGRSRFG
jgi:hypothetical protein